MFKGRLALVSASTLLLAGLVLAAKGTATAPAMARNAGESSVKVLPAILALLLDKESACSDKDGDGYGNPASATCPHPEQDCDDGNADVYPGATELCDGIDNQCAGEPGYGEVDEGCGGPMAGIPAGCFDMGDSSDGCADSDECPVHHVCVSAFEMDVYEVTNAAYAQCVTAGFCTPPEYSSSYTRDSYYGNPDYDGFPLIYVHWFQAEDYCAWVAKRLPTEAEWEYAARGGLQGQRFPWGDEISGPDANYYGSGDPWDNDTSPVGSYDPQPTSPNGYGLYDMAGNVREWVNDWYSSSYYQDCVDQGVVNDPPGPATGSYRVFRGGGWADLSGSLRSSWRYDAGPGYADSYLGFRCARD